MVVFAPGVGEAGFERPANAGWFQGGAGLHGLGGGDVALLAIEDGQFDRDIKDAFGADGAAGDFTEFAVVADATAGLDVGDAGFAGLRELEVGASDGDAGEGEFRIFGFDACPGFGFFDLGEGEEITFERLGGERLLDEGGELLPSAGLGLSGLGEANGGALGFDVGGENIGFIGEAGVHKLAEDVGGFGGGFGKLLADIDEFLFAEGLVVETADVAGEFEAGEVSAGARFVDFAVGESAFDAEFAPGDDPLAEHAAVGTPAGAGVGRVVFAVEANGGVGVEAGLFALALGDFDLRFGLLEVRIVGEGKFLKIE